MTTIEAKDFWRERSVMVPGKWVLAGEHSVLRGGRAIALPHPAFTLALRFRPGVGATGGLSVEPPEALKSVRELVDLAFTKLHERWPKTEWPHPVGEIFLEGNIPLSAGLGSSAALSVAISQWILSEIDRERGEWKGAPTEDELLRLARELEDTFHGKSSGMDVSVVAANAPILFTMEKGPQKLPLRALPRFEFHDTGLRGSTRECVDQVRAIHERDPALGAKLDQAMDRAAQIALEGLENFAAEPAKGLKQIRESMDASLAVFRDWGLVPDAIEKQTADVLRSGALAVRLTGAGRGGFLVSVWE